MTRHLTLIDNVIANKALADESGDRQSSNQHEERAGESGKSAGGIMEVDATSDVESSSTSPPTRRRDPTISKAPSSRPILLPPAPLPITTVSKARGAEPANPLADTPCQYSDVRRKSASAQLRRYYWSILPREQLQPDQCECSEKSTIFARNLPLGVVSWQSLNGSIRVGENLIIAARQLRQSISRMPSQCALMNTRK